MQLDIQKTAFIPIENISTITNHIDKLVEKNMVYPNVNGKIEVAISYKDKTNHECFKSLESDFMISLEEIEVFDVVLGRVNVYVVENQGLSIEYVLGILYEIKKENAIKTESAQEIEIIELEPVTEEVVVEEQNSINTVVEHMPEEDSNKKAEIEKIKDDISKDYENKLADSLDAREQNISIITTKSRENEGDFLSFFAKEEAAYFKVKTLHCPNTESLKEISEEYQIPVAELLLGYDRENKTVTFKLH